MSNIIPAFQFEVRFNHILNFSQIARKILAPFVKLSESVKIENQNTLNERIILSFDENYFIVIGWDRMFIKGQGSLNTFTSKNSPIQTPFLTILDKLKELDEFGAIHNILYAISYIKELEISKEDLYQHFTNKLFTKETIGVMNTANDLAVTLEEKKADSETTISFGPYTGTQELIRRALIPIDVESLGNTDFVGLMFEFKKGYSANNVSFNDFKELTIQSDKLFNQTWKML